MKRHTLDVLSLLFGIVFAGLGLLLLNTDVDVTDLRGRWLAPATAVLVGVVLAIAGFSLIDKEDTEPTGDAAGEPGETENGAEA